MNKFSTCRKALLKSSDASVKYSQNVVTDKIDQEIYLIARISNSSEGQNKNY